MGVQPTDGTVDYPDALQILSPNKDFQPRLLITTGDTSPATAQAARMAAIIQSEYPLLWPETIRALMVHSAEWTPTMLGGREPGAIPKAQWPGILRRYGFGTPNLASALRSARSAVTLICQDEIQPFILDESDVKTNELRFHNLPWPRDVLLDNGTLNAEMRVTLSYFIEPNPGPRQTCHRRIRQVMGAQFLHRQQFPMAREQLKALQRGKQCRSQIKVRMFAIE